MTGPASIAVVGAGNGGQTSATWPRPMVEPRLMQIGECLPRGLLAAMDPDLDGDARERLLANMKSRGILEDGAGKWRAVW
jgi:hypothetical protein